MAIGRSGRNEKPKQNSGQATNFAHCPAHLYLTYLLLYIVACMIHQNDFGIRHIIINLNKLVC